VRSAVARRRTDHTGLAARQARADRFLGDVVRRLRGRAAESARGPRAIRRSPRDRQRRRERRRCEGPRVPADHGDAVAPRRPRGSRGGREGRADVRGLRVADRDPHRRQRERRCHGGRAARAAARDDDRARARALTDLASHPPRGGSAYTGGHMHLFRISWVSLALVGCQPGDAEDALESPIVSSSPPYTGPSVDDPALYPALVAHGRLPDGAFTDTTELAAHSASFTDGVNLAAAPATDPTSTTASRT